MLTRRSFIKRGALFLPALGIAKASAQRMIVDPYRFAAAYAASNAVFDGSNDYMQFTSSGPTGLADSKTFTLATWAKFGDDAATQQMLLNFTESGSAKLQLFRGTDLKIRAYAQLVGDILDLRTSSTVTVASGWTHVLICIDLANTSNRHIYLNGSDESLSVTTYVDDTMDFVNTNMLYTVGAQAAGTGKLNAALSEFWFNDSYLNDPTKFISGGCPISLGSDGSTPTGSSPVFYLKGSGNGFNVNSGTGGNFTVTGSLGTTTGPC